jgi:hypothetical protein
MFWFDDNHFLRNNKKKGDDIQKARCVSEKKMHDYDEEENAHALDGIISEPDKRCSKCFLISGMVMCMGSTVATVWVFVRTFW